MILLDDPPQLVNHIFSFVRIPYRYGFVLPLSFIVATTQVGDKLTGSMRSTVAALCCCHSREFGNIRLNSFEEFIVVALFYLSLVATLAILHRLSDCPFQFCQTFAQEITPRGSHRKRCLRN
ncbi:hypothetical protein BJ912DRAFT_692515 [Pholiota molesta]|nr:hypothetical protein BJ912DRAFT_692515 [Pholiota molesta]